MKAKRTALWARMILMCGFAAVLATAYIVSALARPGSLLARSTRIGFPGSASLYNYQWKSSKEILCFSEPSQGSYRLECVNTSRGSMTPLATFTSKTRMWGGEDQARLSPDGKWALWVGETAYATVATDGSRRSEIPNPVQRYHGCGNYYRFEAATAWMQDSRHWVEVKQKPSGPQVLVVHDAASPIVRRLSLGTMGGPPVVLGVTPEDHAVLWDQAGTFLDIDLGRPQGSVKKWTVKRPPVGDVSDVVLSPDGQRLCWKTYSWVINRLPALLERMLERIRIDVPTTTYLVWTSRLDGSHMREIGRSRVQQHIGQPFRSFRWTPDGTKISYVYDNALWTVPVD
jgi:hypothetical protein